MQSFRVQYPITGAGWRGSSGGNCGDRLPSNSLCYQPCNSRQAGELKRLSVESVEIMKSQPGFVEMDPVLFGPDGQVVPDANAVPVYHHRVTGAHVRALACPATFRRGFLEH